MPQVGDLIVYIGDGNNGTTAGTSYNGIITNLNSPGGWGPTGITINAAGTPTAINTAVRDSLYAAQYAGTGQPNGTWRRLV